MRLGVEPRVNPVGHPQGRPAVQAESQRSAQGALSRNGTFLWPIGLDWLRVFNAR